LTLGQVFSNLLRNAVKFTPAGGRITVRTRNGPEDVVVEVQDSGIGIGPAQRV
jgi:signal transduction histidine kinase